MPRISIEQLGPLLKSQRGNRGIREVAAEVGISPATMSRVETGKQPDLDTFTKICKWLSLDPGEVLGCVVPSVNEGAVDAASGVQVYAHFRAQKVMTPKTAQHLGELILAVQRAVGGEREE